MSANINKMVVAAARALCRHQAEACNVDDQDTWKIYGDEFVEDAKSALEACGALGLLAALEQIKRLGKDADGNLVDVRSMLADIADAAIAKATGAAR